MFLLRTHKSNRNYPDGNLTEKFTLDELLNNVMLYWLSGSITSSMRFYAENIGSNRDYVMVSGLLTFYSVIFALESCLMKFGFDFNKLGKQKG